MVKVLGGMRRQLGADPVCARARGVRELLDELAARVAGLADQLFADPQAAEREPHRDLRVLVNGRGIDFLDGWNTRLDEHDGVTLHHTGARGFPGG